MFGRPEHQAHLRETAIPLFLSLGTWDAYIETASILYHKVCFTRHANKIAVLKLPSCPDTLRIRSLIHKLEIHIRMPQDLKLFDIGLSDTQSNVPTALHSMRVHGRLREVDFFLHVPESMDYNYDCMADVDLLGVHLPMARLQIASWDQSAILPEVVLQGRSTTVQPGRAVVTPVLLASRAFQSDLLPLLERGVFERSNLTLRLFSAEGDVRDAKVDGHSMFEYWFGATILDVLPNSTAWHLGKEKQVGLFPFLPLIEDSSNVLCLKSEEDSDKNMVDVPETHNIVAYSKNELCVETAEYRERGDDLLSSPVRYPESSIDSALFQEALEDLPSTITRTVAEATGEIGKPRSQANTSPLHKENDLDESRRLASDISPDQDTSHDEAVEPLASTSSTAEIMEAGIITDTIDMPTEQSLPGRGASVAAEALCEGITTGEHGPHQPEPNDTRETPSKKHVISHKANAVGMEPTTSVIDDTEDSDTDTDTDSDTDSDSGSQGETEPSKHTAAEHKSERIEHTAVYNHVSRADGNLLYHKSDSESPDKSSTEEFPPSRSTAFSKNRAGPPKVPIPTRETVNTSDVSSHSSDYDTDTSSDSSSSGDEDGPRSPTIDAPLHHKRRQPLDDGSLVNDDSLVMTGALPSNDLSSEHSSDSDSEMSSDSEISSSCNEGEVSSKTLSQVGKVFGARAGQGEDSASANKGKVAAPTAPEGSVDTKARSTKASSLSSSDDLGSDTDDSDTDSDDLDTDSGDSKIGSEAWRAKAKPASQASKPVVGTPPVRSTTVTKRQIQPTQQKKPQGANSNNSTPRSSNKRKAPPQSADSTPLSKSQRNRRRRNMAKQRKKRRLEAAQD